MLPQIFLDRVWFIKMVDVSSKEPTKPVLDDHGHIIPTGTAFMEGHFPEKTETLKSSTVYKVSRKMTLFHKEIVLYPYVETAENKGLF